MAYAAPRRITLRQTDAAGVLFFAEQLALVHEVYEEWLAQAGLPLRRILDERAFGLPIARAETELLQPLFVDDEVSIALSCARVGETSFTLAHEVSRAGRVVGRGATVHVCVDPRAGRPAPLPDALRTALAGLAAPATP